MDIEDIAIKWADEHPNSSIEQAFLAGVEYRMNVKDNIEDRKKKFKIEVCLFARDYDIEMLKSFYEYWTETSKSGKKMKFEMEKTWETSKRLARWAKNNSSYGNRTYSQQRTDSPSLFAEAARISRQG